MNAKYLLRYLYSSFTADCACALVHWIVAGVFCPDTVVFGGLDNSFCNGQILSSCGTGRR